MSPKSRWTTAEIPDQSGKVVLITGANSGLGFESALALVRKGAHVVMACRSADRAGKARDEIRAQVPAASLTIMPLDLTNLSSIRDLAAAFCERYGRLDVLLNNAGIMAPPHGTTVDGFELQLGTNHLGHFALTGLLLDCLLDAPAGRVVTTYSMAEMIGRISGDNLQGARRYYRWLAYGQSKLANLLFALELERRLEAIGSATSSMAAHPGLSHTNLQVAGLQTGGTAPVQAWLMRTMRDLFFQSAQMGALPQLYAATAPEARGGACYGPGRLFQVWGHPVKVRPFNPAWRNQDLARRLWEASEDLTGVRYL